MISKRGNSRFYFANSGKILPKSKRSQSEIITTVLIILLVLAAIVIVWQVVQGTIGAGKNEIEKKKDCFGLDIVVVKAIAAKGECSYTEDVIGSPCPTLTNQVIGACPTVIGCNLDSWSQTTPGTVLVRREGISTAKSAKASVLVNEKINGTSNTNSNFETAFTTDTFNVDGLSITDTVKVSSLLSDGTPCQLSINPTAVTAS